ncbi:MAG: hypothetical protein M5U33_02745 [Pseudorhodoplanes sp.]|nr:hypothetical protein [Pseudorhodoplanes sp.]
MQWNPQSALADFRAVAGLAGIQLADRDITIELLPAPHVAPSRLPPGMMAVYVFSRGAQVLKVGKVGPNSHARYSYQHYKAGSAMSTLASSLLADKALSDLAETDPSAVGAWIKGNIDRVNFVVEASLGIHLLTLLEAFLQCRLKPRYEGFSSQRLG